VVFWRVYVLYLSAEKSYRRLSLSVVSDDQLTLCSSLIPECSVGHVTSVFAIHVSCIVLGTLNDNYDVSAGFL
jgi:hypothetical protein